MLSLNHLAFIITQVAAFAIDKKRMNSVAPDKRIPTTSQQSTPLQMSTSVEDNIATIIDHYNSSDNVPISPIHFCFIVHGHQGRPTDLSYVHNTIKAKAAQHNAFANAKSSDSCPVGRTNKHKPVFKKRRSKRDRILSTLKKSRGVSDKEPSESSDTNRVEDNDNQLSKSSATIESDIAEDKQQSKEGSTLVIHNSVCNEGKTNDGVIKGGERLANEMVDVIREEILKRGYTNITDQVDVTISLVGNSLGGIYARYAIAELAELCKQQTVERQDEDTENNTLTSYLLDDYINLHFNVFCSTAAPHLGCASHTYIPIPRSAEIGVASFLGTTGSDLFRRNDLLHTMGTSDKFLTPLASFRKRTAYINAYKTDFPVPGSTAGFLDKNSDYPHYFVDPLAQQSDEDDQREASCPATEQGLIAATLYTPQLPEYKIDDKVDDLTAMSSSLDSLGWTKHLIDIRKNVARLPSIFKSEAVCAIRQMKMTSDDGKVTSQDLEKAIAQTDSLFNLPLGHNAICAFERGTPSKNFNSGGRPVMDSLAIELVNEISKYDIK